MGKVLVFAVAFRLVLVGCSQVASEPPVAYEAVEGYYLPGVVYDSYIEHFIPMYPTGERTFLAYYGPKGPQFCAMLNELLLTIPG